MATFQIAGLETTGLQGFRDKLREKVREVWGQNVSFDPQTIQAQLIDIFALQLRIEEEALVSALNGVNLISAVGAQLDNWGAGFSIPRKPATYTIVTAQLTGEPNTIIPAGSRAETVNGAIFQSSEIITLDGSGDGSGQFVSLDIGAVKVAENTLTEIISSVAGWNTINNEAEGVTGDNIETDSVYRSRLLNRLGQSQTGTQKSIQSRLLQVDGVTHVKVLANNTTADATKEGVSVPAGGITIVIRGGRNSDIGEAMPEAVILGQITGGNNTQTVAGIDYSFQRTQDRRVTMVIEITISPDYPADGNSQIRKNLIEYFDENVGLGETINENNLSRPIYNVKGHVMTALTLKWLNGETPRNITNINADRIYRLAEEDITITATGAL